MPSGEFYYVSFIDYTYDHAPREACSDDFERSVDLPSKGLAFAYARRNADKFAYSGYCQIYHVSWRGPSKDSNLAEHEQLAMWEIAYKGESPELA